MDAFEFRQIGPLTESTDSAGQRKVTGKGTFGMVDVPTANGRLYRRTLMDREINRLREQISARKVYGELDHPADGKTLMQRVSHLITSLEIRPDGVIYGEMEVIPGTQQGQNLLAILEAKGAVGVSSRGFGTTTKDANGNDVVNDDYTLMTFDAVGDPAAASAYPEFKGVGGASSYGESKEFDQMDMQELKQKHPALYESIKKEAISASATAIAEARKDERAKVEKEAQEEIKKIAPSMVSEARKKIEAQFKSDPKLAGALGLVEALKPIMAPFVVGGDAAKALAEKDEEIVELQARLQESNEKIVNLTEERDMAVKIGKRSVLHLHMEKRLGDSGQGAHPCAVQLRSMIGRIDESTTLEGLDRKMETVAGSLLEERVAQRAQNQEIVRLREKLEEKNRTVVESQELALQMALSGYIAKKCARHPASSMLEEAIAGRNPRSKVDIDTLFDELKESFRGSETLRNVQAGVSREVPQRRSMGPSGVNNGGNRLLSEGRRGPAPKGKNTQPKQQIFGVQLEEIQKLAGVTGLNG
jgi:hypothetical protein